MRRPTAGFEVVTTRAGHRAVLDRQTGEVMHPVVSPQREAEQLYLGPARLRDRLLQDNPSALCLLDVGLGAGSNACAAMRLAHELAGRARPLQLYSFDRTTDALMLACAEAHAQGFEFDAAFCALARELVERGQVKFPGGEWFLRLGELPQSLLDVPAADVVFWDPFSPRRNPELWSVAAFQALRQVCASGATVHTYSGATATRSAMLLAGFAVGVGPVLGGGKRATMAAVDYAVLENPLPPSFLQRLQRSSAPFPEDAPSDALQRLAVHAQFQAL